jgi:hypothetical protein
VKFEGKGVARAFDLLLHNDKNTPPGPVLQGPVMVMGSGAGDVDHECVVCNEKL